jgi:hypothetical protein
MVARTTPTLARTRRRSRAHDDARAIFPARAVAASTGNPSYAENDPLSVIRDSRTILPIVKSFPGNDLVM